MTKYLFLLGFSLFSISFLSTPVVAGEVYTGIMYTNPDIYAVSCSFVGVSKILKSKDEGNIPPECEEGAFSKFVLLEERGHGLPDDNGSFKYKYIRSFIATSDGTEDWQEAYLRVSKSLKITNCKYSDEYKVTLDVEWKEYCDQNLAAYRDWKQKNYVPGIFW